MSDANDTAAPPVDLVHEETRYGHNLRREMPVLWWSTLVGPFVLTAIVLVVLAITRGYEWVLQLMATAFVTFFGLGPFVILLGKGGGGGVPADAVDAEERARFAFFTSMELALMVTWMDVMVAMLLVFHAGFLYRIPKLGPALLKVGEEGEFFMKYQPWMRRFTFLGLTIFVALPIAATGSVGGALFGKLLGMSRGATLAAIGAGTLIGNGAIYLVGKHLIARVPFFDPSNPLNLLGGAGLIVLLGLVLGWRYKKLKKQVLAAEAVSKAA